MQVFSYISKTNDVKENDRDSYSFCEYFMRK